MSLGSLQELASIQCLQTTKASFLTRGISYCQAEVVPEEKLFLLKLKFDFKNPLKKIHLHELA